MNNITLDTTNFSEQLGLYDFFNVIVSGAVFVFGVSVLSGAIYRFFWTDMTLAKGLGIVLFIYIVGVALQEIGSVLDRHFIGVKDFTRSTFLFDIEDMNIGEKLKHWYTTMYKKGKSNTESKRGTKAEANKESESDICSHPMTEKWNWVLNNKILLMHYRNLAKQIFEECFPGESLDEKMYNDEKFNLFVFSIIQYHVSCLGKDRKAEKLHALYSLSKTLMVCFGLLVIFYLFASLGNCLDARSDLLAAVFAVDSLLLTVLFFFRMKKCEKYMVLILLGKYEASLRTSKKAVFHN